MRIVCTAIFLLSFWLDSLALNEAKATIDTPSILIGDWGYLKLEVTREKGGKIFWPGLTESIPIDSFRYLEILEISPVDTLVNEAGILEYRTLKFTVFDSGYYVIPPIVFKIQQDTNTYKEARTEPILLEVHSLKVDTAQAFKPIKRPLDLPFKISEIKYHIIGGIILLLLLLAAYFIYQRRKIKPKEVKKIIKPRIPPDEIAMKRLVVLEEKKLWQKGKLKGYYSELTEIVREYIEGRYQILALESTTDDILEKMQKIEMPPGLLSDLSSMLLAADLVKFAKANPLPDQHTKYIELAYEFVRQTKQKPEQVNT